MADQGCRDKEQPRHITLTGISFGSDCIVNGVFIPAGSYYPIAAPAPSPISAEERKPFPGEKFWLWKNFVDGRPEYWAFDNPYPINLDNGDPQALGEPCGYAIFKESRLGRDDVTEAQVIAAIKRARQRPMPSTGASTTAPNALDWTEDFSHENGNYQCRCIECNSVFLGHKRRVVCKVCASLPSATRSRQG